MKLKVFLDTDVVLDVIFERTPHFVNSQEVLSLVERNKIHGYSSSLILANCHYIISNNKTNQVASKVVSKLRSILTILPFTDKEIGESLNSSFKDFEDGIQCFIAMNNGIDLIITRNVADYKKSSINIFTPTEFLNSGLLDGDA